MMSIVGGPQILAEAFPLEAINEGVQAATKCQALTFATVVNEHD